MDGSIDFLLPARRFDSPSVFAALLDAERGGRFQIAPALDGAARKQLYLPDTNVLLTRFLDDDGVAEVSDFMPVEDAGPRAQPRAPREDGARRGPLPDALRAALRLRRAPPTRSSCAATTEVLFVGRPAHGELALRLRVVGADARRGRRRASRSSRCGADESASFVLEVALPGDAVAASTQPDYERDAFKADGELLARAGSAAAPTGAAGARW